MKERISLFSPTNLAIFRELTNKNEEIMYLHAQNITDR